MNRENYGLVYNGGMEEYNKDYFSFQDSIKRDFESFKCYVSSLRDSYEKDILLEKINEICLSICKNRFLEECCLNVLNNPDYLVFDYFPVNENGYVILDGSPIKVILKRGLKFFEIYFVYSELLGESINFIESFKVIDNNVNMSQTIVDAYVNSIFQSPDRCIKKLIGEFK